MYLYFRRQVLFFPCYWTLIVIGGTCGYFYSSVNFQMLITYVSVFILVCSHSYVLMIFNTSSCSATGSSIWFVSVINSYPLEIHGAFKKEERNLNNNSSIQAPLSSFCSSAVVDIPNSPW